MTVLTTLLSRVWLSNGQLSLPSPQEQAVPQGTARVRTTQLANLVVDWLFKLFEGAKRMAPTALVVALRLLR
jgi:hypothetical protein